MRCVATVVRFLAVCLLVVAGSLGAGTTVATDEESVGVDRLERHVVVEEAERLLPEVVSVHERLYLTEETYVAHVNAVDAPDLETYYASTYENSFAYENVSVTRTTLSSGHLIEIEIATVHHYALDHTETELGDDLSINYARTDVMDPTQEAIVEVYQHSVSMPGDIRESNTEDIDGSVATWTITESPPERLSVTTESMDIDVDDLEIPDPAELDDVDVPNVSDYDGPVVDDIDVSNETDVDVPDVEVDIDDSQPGLGVVGVVAALIAVVFRIHHRN